MCPSVVWRHQGLYVRGVLPQSAVMLLAMLLAVLTAMMMAMMMAMLLARM